MTNNKSKEHKDHMQEQLKFLGKMIPHPYSAGIFIVLENRGISEKDVFLEGEFQKIEQWGDILK
jgi:hypothetical protein